MSFPTPLSPVIRTFALDWAATAISRRRLAIAGLEPTSSHSWLSYIGTLSVGMISECEPVEHDERSVVCVNDVIPLHGILTDLVRCGACAGISLVADRALLRHARALSSWRRHREEAGGASRRVGLRAGTHAGLLSARAAAEGRLRRAGSGSHQRSACSCACTTSRSSGRRTSKRCFRIGRSSIRQPAGSSGWPSTSRSPRSSGSTPARGSMPDSLVNGSRRGRKPWRRWAPRRDSIRSSRHRRSIARAASTRRALFVESVKRLGLHTRAPGSLIVQSFDEQPLKDLTRDSSRHCRARS